MTLGYVGLIMALQFDGRYEMKQILWTKVLLTVYKKLPKMVQLLDNARDNLIKTGLGVGYNRWHMTNEELFDKMISLNYRRLGLINAKVLVDEGIRRLPERLRGAIIARFFTEDLDGYAKECGICMRTAFKRVESAIEKLAEIFKNLGYGEKKLNLEYKDEPLLTKVGKRLEILYYSKSS